MIPRARQLKYAVFGKALTVRRLVSSENTEARARVDRPGILNTLPNGVARRRGTESKPESGPENFLNFFLGRAGSTR
ncbi:MAG: hypothetical protein QOH39_342 [Verrucomicrobiota bacterium]|jgi:hypothetical protein